METIVRGAANKAALTIGIRETACRVPSGACPDIAIPLWDGREVTAWPTTEGDLLSDDSLEISVHPYSGSDEFRELVEKLVRYGTSFGTIHQGYAYRWEITMREKLLEAQRNALASRRRRLHPTDGGVQ
jgi:hypothetical protein